jgi:hypothetical protein
MSVFLLSGAAHADLEEIIEDYCEEVGQNVTNTLNELEDASGDLEECSEGLDDCLSGIFQADPASCINDYRGCITFGENDQRQACNEFLVEFRNDTRRAKKRADRQNVEDEFLLWLKTASDECLNPAKIAARVCADQLIGE